MDIRHIPGKKNPADSLRRQLVSGALVSKGSVKDVNAEYVQKLRISDSATDEEIQDALQKLLKSSPQCNQGPQGSIQSMNEDTSPQCTETRPTVFAATAISKIQLRNQFKILCILSFSMKFLMLKFCKSCQEEQDKSRQEK